MMEKRNRIMTLSVLAIVVLLFSGSALANLEVNHSYHWENESDRCQGNGYTINVHVQNQWDYPIEITSIGVIMDWQDPNQYYDYFTVRLEPGDGHDAQIYIQIPTETYVGDHNFQITVDYTPQQETGAEQEQVSIDGWDFYVEPADGGGDGDDGSEGIFGDGGMSIDWESIDAGIPAGAMGLLFVALFIGIIVVMPVVYFLSKD